MKRFMIAAFLFASAPAAFAGGSGSVDDAAGGVGDFAIKVITALIEKLGDLL